MISQLYLAPRHAAPKTLLDSKRAQNLGIFLSGFKMSVDEIDTKLNIVDSDKGLPLESVMALKRFQPTEEDVEMYSNFSGDKASLPPTDQFMMKLCSLSNFSTRVDLLLTIREFPEQFEELLPSISTALAACNELTGNQNFTVVLEFILAIGNYMNGGTARGAAHGFQLKSLPKLADTRGRQSAKYTLVHYLVDVLKQHDPLALGVVNEMNNVPKAAEASVKALVAEVDVMKKDLLRISRNADNLLRKKENPNHTDLSFSSAVKAFVSRYDKEIKVMDRLCEELQTAFASVLEKFGEQQSTMSEEIFRSVRMFLDLFKKAVKDQDGFSYTSESSKAAKKSSPVVPPQSSFNLLAQIASANKEGKRSQKAETEVGGKGSKPVSKPVPVPGPSEPVVFNGHDLQDIHLQNSFDATEDASNSSLSSKSSFTPGQNDGVGSGVTITYASAINNSPKRPSSVSTASPRRKSTDNPTHQVKFGSPSTVRSLSVPSRQSIEPPTKEGHLQKLSGGKKRAAHWNTRFFELSETGYLHYYKKKDGKCMGSIYLRGCPISIDVNDSHIIVLESEGRVWQLKADSPIIAQEWSSLLEFYTTT
jgi:hypothetical protein